MDWRVKALIQRVLGFLPGGQWVNDNALMLIKHHVSWSQEVTFYRTCVERHLAMLRKAECPLRPGMRVLELGSGPNLTIATLLALHGLKMVPVDIVRMCQWKRVKATITYLADQPESARVSGLPSPPDLEGRIARLAATKHLDEYCEAAGIEYIAPYQVETLRAGGYGAFDLTWSNYVLEHIPGPPLTELMWALHAATRPGGVGSHLVDLQDHFGWGFLSSKRCSYLNFRRYSPQYWRFFAGGPIVHLNRLMPSDYDCILRDAEFETIRRSETRWESAELPIPVEQIHPQFRTGYAEDELWVTHLHYVIRKPPSGSNAVVE